MHAIYSHTEHTYIRKNESKHSEMGPVRQNPIQRTVRSVHMRVHCTVHNCCTQYCTEQNRVDNLPSYSPDNHYCSDAVYLREGAQRTKEIIYWSHPFQIHARLLSDGGNSAFRLAFQRLYQKQNKFTDIVHLLLNACLQQES